MNTSTCDGSNKINNDFRFRLNYVLGGLAAGGVYGAWMRSGVAVFVSGLIFGKYEYLT